MNVMKYIKNTYRHVPDGYHASITWLNVIADVNEDKLFDCIIDAWRLGFEQCYRAAKAGKLDFQQKTACKDGR